MSQIKAIIFDLDGTLIDSVDDLANSVNYTLGRLDLPLHTREEIKSFVGDGVQKLIKRSLGQTHMEKFDDAFAIFMKHYGAHCTDNTVVYPEVAETISFLAEKYSLAVLTNKSATFSHRILTALKIDYYFKEVLGGDSLPTKKPDPAGILYLAAKWGLAPDQLVMVGDHATDIEVGQRAGCKTVFIEGGIGETRGLKPDFIIKSMDELPNLFV
ncbi:MAG: HAD-IA family hydrolase [Desulfobulbaceae bacterium]|nr:HAD-IA family hydrolase [Desulfobulbaceae bacterium]